MPLPDAPPEAPQEGAGTAPTPPPEVSPPEEPKVFDEAYVSKLRDENSRHRREKKALAERLLDGTISMSATDMADPDDLLLYVDRADLLDEDGMPDPERIVTAQNAVLAKKPHLRSRKPRGDIDQGGRGQQTETFSFNDWLKSAAG